MASALPHHGEEPPISGTRGSGTLFFSGCSSRCFFCQNRQISIEGLGEPIGFEALLDLARNLLAQGVHNLNFVTPDHFWPHIRSLCEALRAEGALAPFVFNGSGYHATACIEEAVETIDIFLPDFKFADPDLAALCMGDSNYPNRALDTFERMVAARGFLTPWDPTGSLSAAEGVLVRHLVLPGRIDNSLRVLRLLRERFGRLLPLSVMSQYRPMPYCATKAQLDRPLQATEYRRVIDEVERLGFRNVFFQPEPSDAAFLPDFEQTANPFPGNHRPPVHTFKGVGN